MKPSPSRKPTAFIHVDVDGLWAVRRCYGRPEGATFRADPCWDQGVPGARRLLGELGLPASFFLVGRDLQVAAKRAEARRLADAGFELANHSYSHRLGMTLWPVGRIADEITRTHDAIAALGAGPPVGFRAPGYDVDARVVRTLRRLGYKYDASVLPTWLSPALRAADAWMTWRGGGTFTLKRQFGRLAYALAPRRPYVPDPNRLRAKDPDAPPGALVEIPVGTLGPARLPFTAATVLAAGTARTLGWLETRRRRGRPLLMVLHAIDFVDGRRAPVFDRAVGLGGFDLTAAEKQRRLRPVLEALADGWNVVRTDKWVEEAISKEHRSW